MDIQMLVTNVKGKVKRVVVRNVTRFVHSECPDNDKEDGLLVLETPNGTKVFHHIKSFMTAKEEKK